jgi:hypothetical protein
VPGPCTQAENLRDAARTSTLRIRRSSPRRAKEEENANSPGMSAEADNPFRMHSYEKPPRSFVKMPRYKFIGLKIPWNQGFMAVWRCRSALSLGFAHNFFGIRTYERGPRKPFGIRTCKFIALKAPWNEHLQKKGGGGGSRYRPGGCLTDWTGSKPDTVSQWQARVILRSPSRIPSRGFGTRDGD